MWIAKMSEYITVLNDWFPPTVRAAKNSINNSLKEAGHDELRHDSPEWSMKRRNQFYELWVDKDED